MDKGKEVCLSLVLWGRRRPGFLTYRTYRKYEGAREKTEKDNLHQIVQGLSFSSIGRILVFFFFYCTVVVLKSSSI